MAALLQAEVDDIPPQAKPTTTPPPQIPESRDAFYGYPEERTFQHVRSRLFCYQLAY